MKVLHFIRYRSPPTNPFTWLEIGPHMPGINSKHGTSVNLWQAITFNTHDGAPEQCRNNTLWDNVRCQSTLIITWDFLCWIYFLEIGSHKRYFIFFVIAFLFAAISLFGVLGTSSGSLLRLGVKKKNRSPLAQTFKPNKIILFMRRKSIKPNWILSSTNPLLSPF